MRAIKGRIDFRRVKHLCITLEMSPLRGEDSPGVARQAPAGTAEANV